MSPPPSAPDREQVFRSLYGALYPDLLRFAQRRVDADQAEDVVAEAFLVLWRRLADLPRREEDARAWAFGITRNVLLNSRRSELRRHALGVRLAEPTAVHDGDADADGVVSAVDLAVAWRRLSETHQEAIALTAFEELSAPHAAAVLGISPVAFRLRLSRARRALRLHLDHRPSGPRAAAPVPERTATR